MAKQGVDRDVNVGGSVGECADGVEIVGTDVTVNVGVDAGLDVDMDENIDVEKTKDGNMEQRYSRDSHKDGWE
jgi:hypothetical protein